MVRKDGAYLKTERIAKIRQIIVRNTPVEKNKLISHIEATIGLTKKRIEEYLDILLNSEQVWYNEDNNTYSGVSPNEQSL